MQGVVTDAGEQPRLARVQPVQAHEVQAGTIGDDTTVLHRVAVAVEDRRIDPVVVPAVPGGLDDRRDPRGPQVELGEHVLRVPVVELGDLLLGCVQARPVDVSTPVRNRVAILSPAARL